MAYIAYQIWLYKNSLVFDAEVVPAHRILDRAISLAIEYYRFDTASSSVDAPMPRNFISGCYPEELD